MIDHPSGTAVLAQDIAVPQGFNCRVVARCGQPIGGTRWHPAPDGGACLSDGNGWIYVSNSDIPLAGGASAIRFGPEGEVKDAYRIVDGTSLNHAGTVTPWNTWLSAEDIFLGRVYEADPHGGQPARAREALGRFKHGGMAVDADRRVIYLTEAEPDGCFYRFTPWVWTELSFGMLEVLCETDGAVRWRQIPEPAPGFLDVPTRYQVETALRFDGGGACRYADDECRFSTASGDRLWDAVDETLRPVAKVDDTARLVVTGDGDDLDVDLVTGDTGVRVARLPGHRGSAVTGLAFSPDGTRLYFSSQRGCEGDSRGGVTFEVSGPFGTDRQP